MQTIFKGRVLILVPETEGETEQLSAWKSESVGRVLHVAANEGTGLALNDLGPKEVACNEPINVTSMSPDPAIQLISNFARTPFDLDGRRYASVESFWQGLKFDGAGRTEVGVMEGGAARRAGMRAGYGPNIRYEGETIPVGTWSHWELMKRACRAKFAQNEDARSALLATGRRPLVHRVRKDSHTIPGVIMAEIWMTLRTDLGRTATAVPVASNDPQVFVKGSRTAVPPDRDDQV